MAQSFAYRWWSISWGWLSLLTKCWYLKLGPVSFWVMPGGWGVTVLGRPVIDRLDPGAVDRMLEGDPDR